MALLVYDEGRKVMILFFKKRCFEFKSSLWLKFAGSVFTNCNSAIPGSNSGALVKVAQWYAVKVSDTRVLP